MTSVAGYINAYTSIAQRPNAQLEFDNVRPLGQYSLNIALKHDLAGNREILISYGAKHLVHDRALRGPKPKAPGGQKRQRQQ
eukprot:7656288-Lingulodinium_polyedra.AAC.1